MKKLSLVLSTVSCALIALGANAGDNYKGMHKQLNIMNDIITSATNGEGRKKDGKVNNVSSLYLYDQGVVFTISSNSRSNRWGNFNVNFAMPTLAPIAPISKISFDDDGDDFERSIEITVEKALAIASTNFEIAIEHEDSSREKYRNLRDKQRDLKYEMRDLAREARDLEYQSKRAEVKVKKELKKELKQLGKKKLAFEKNRKSIDEQVAKIRTEQQNQVVAQEKQRASYYQSLTASLAETLCLYGNGLKALPKNEHVSLILKSGGDKDGRRYKDQIYVFNKKDISACSIDKITSVQLISKAKSYQF